MTDWRRMQWQYRANVYAEIARCLCIVLAAEEVAWAIKYHFPLWDDISGALTGIVYWTSMFIDKHTRIYRWDLDQ